jgi:signal transduction histidine kinase
MRLATKIIASSLAVIVILTGVAGYFSVRNNYFEFELAQRRFAQATATTIRQELTAAWQREGSAGVVRFLDAASVASNGALKIRWVWLDEQASPLERPRTRQLANSIPFGETVSIVGESDEGQRSLFTYVPVELPTHRRGALEFAESLAPLERQMWRDVLLTLGLIGLLALASIVTAYVTGINWVARPLEKLIAKTERIGLGDFATPLELKSRDELGALARSLNQMCERLERQQSDLAREAEQRLMMLDQLRHADRLKTVGRLAAGVGHELGTPLNVIAGRASLIAQGRLAADEVQSSARVIKDEADRVTGIVRQLLDFARRRPPQRTSLNLIPLLSRTVELLQPMAERTSVRLCFQKPPERDGSSPCQVRADANQLQQVFTNIIVNAIQAMPQGGTVRIELSSATIPSRTTPDAARPERHWMVSVIDHGTGIAAEHLEQVFEPFFTTKDVNEGTGLGLSIAYGIVHEHQGWIDVTSRPGDGSRFDVFLPQETIGCPDES